MTGLPPAGLWLRVLRLALALSWLAVGGLLAVVVLSTGSWVVFMAAIGAIVAVVVATASLTISRRAQHLATFTAHDLADGTRMSSVGVLRFPDQGIIEVAVPFVRLSVGAEALTLRSSIRIPSFVIPTWQIPWSQIMAADLESLSGLYAYHRAIRLWPTKAPPVQFIPWTIDAHQLLLEFRSKGIGPGLTRVNHID